MHRTCPLLTESGHCSSQPLCSSAAALVHLGFSVFQALLILTTDFGWSLRGVVNTKPGGHVVRAQSSSTVFSKTPVSGCALTFMSVGKPARARRSSWMFAGTLRNSSSGFISYGSASDSRRAARDFAISSSRRYRAKPQIVSEKLWSCFILANWPIITKKRGSRERSSPPCQIRTLILPRCPGGARAIFILTLTLTNFVKFFELPGHAWRDRSRLRTIKRFSSRRL